MKMNSKQVVVLSCTGVGYDRIVSCFVLMNGARLGQIFNNSGRMLELEITK